ncbi:hypothetical protein COX69_02290 [Candidatus Falkowbacteria bacterium CG_4_10_14_0_2_um_filter_48_10]|uniref:Uncharacterized protein n=1 Tax=Candidatus Falkowbacteria bacterium CG23_combo_of_CG06-09_8_20_14_all_49_15 TaxID=1974572 RepID=A0A2G9ZJI8_9BACT|nr:MAG: hypothetical protein COX22_04915 [Candidatus Falkowbacteria bacterium CG23_combo_of_CG06-09_8_20_14_all_49_15]PJA08450.1 MAG: hypothetical protein COX69_02290 [Candidatus Falkowbacteria bacterium CG_4_10_14_0_2_um_filter_48_10]
MAAHSPLIWRPIACRQDFPETKNFFGAEEIYPAINKNFLSASVHHFFIFGLDVFLAIITKKEYGKDFYPGVAWPPSHH